MKGVTLPAFFQRLDLYKRDRIYDLFRKLMEDENYEGVLWGGSMSYKQDISKADADLFCLVKDVDSAVNSIKRNWMDLPEVDVIIDQGSFSWTGRILTIYYRHDLDFSADICLVAESSAKRFLWEPNGYVVFDRFGKIRGYLDAQSGNTNFSIHPLLKSYPFSQAVITLKKIAKNISRNHLWNALAMINLLRTYLMQIIRLYVIKDASFLGRVDRDLEDVIPSDVNSDLSQSVAAYDSEDIARSALILSEILESLLDRTMDTGEDNLRDWILKQIHHERNKLRAYISESTFVGP